MLTESVGLSVLWLAASSAIALVGAALTGAGFSLVFPALGLEAVRRVDEMHRGSAISVYTAFIDLSLGIAGPLGGIVMNGLGYGAAFCSAAALSFAAGVGCQLSGRSDVV